MSMGNFNAGGMQGGGGKGGFQGPNTGAPGGGGMDYEGNPADGGMGLQFNTGGAQPQPGFGMPPGGLSGGQGSNPMQGLIGGITNQIGNFAAPALNQITPGAGNNLGPQLGRAIGISQPGGQPPNPGFGRFQPGGMIPPAGARPGFGNPRQVNPGQGPMQPGQMTGGKGGFRGPANPPSPGRPPRGFY